MQTSIKKSMPFKIDFWSDFNGFWEGKWSQVGTKMGSKIDVNFERRFLQNRAPTAVGARLLRFGGSKLGAKIDQKSIKKGGQHGKAS